MNCHKARKKITDVLAGETVVPPYVASHQANCAECQTFYENQRQLFASIDTGLRDRVNSPVPLSFFLRLRATLDQRPAPRSLGISRWTYAALAATLVLALTGVAFRNHFLRQDASSEPNHIVARSDRQPVPKPPPIASEVANPRTTPVRSQKASPAAAAPSEVAPEVIVLAQEREAFARFISHTPSKAGVGPTLRPEVPELTDAPIDIALIEIQDVEITPLESMNGDGQ
jgi:hypothetical protein